MTAVAVGLHESYGIFSCTYNVLCGYHDMCRGPHFLNMSERVLVNPRRDIVTDHFFLVPPDYQRIADNLNPQPLTFLPTHLMYASGRYVNVSVLSFGIFHDTVLSIMHIHMHVLDSLPQTIIMHTCPICQLKHHDILPQALQTLQTLRGDTCTKQ